jgi:hypothetical protein
MAPVAPNLVTVMHQGQRLQMTAKTENDVKSTTNRSDEDISQGDSYHKRLRKSCEDEMEDGEDNSDSEVQPRSISGFGEGNVVHVTRCRNPDPLESDSDQQYEATSNDEGVVLVAAANFNALTIPTAAPSFSPDHSKALRPNAIMAEAEVKGRKDAQVDFPLSNHRNTTISNIPQSSTHRQQQRHYAQQQQQHTIRASPSISHSSMSSRGKVSHSIGGGEGSINDHSEGSPILHPTPMFQRLVSDGVQELKAYARIIENQNRRLAELETVHRDLETRLEVQSNGILELEKTLEDREHLWAEQIRDLEKERDQLQSMVTLERSKNMSLMDQVVRKDQDIHRMLQRKVSCFFACSSVGYECHDD